MNPQLQSLLDLIQQSENLSDAEKTNISNTIKEVDKVLSVTEFKLGRTEQVKRTTAILLEETIQELEQKRKAVEAQNHELEIESSLERVRTQAMSMRKPDDLLDICEVLYTELGNLGFSELRNTMINIFEDEKSSFLNYDYSSNSGKSITNFFYNTHPYISQLVKQIKSSNDAFSETSFTGPELEEWRAFRQRNGEPDDPNLDNATSLFYYFFSIGIGAIGISTYNAISNLKLDVLKRFRNVFTLSYQRYTDIALAEAQAREAQIEASLERVRSKAMAMQKSEDLANAVAIVFEELDKLNTGILRCGIAILDPEKPRGDIWITIKSDEGNKIHVSGDEPLDIHPLLKGAYDAWLKQQDFSYALEGDDLVTYYQALDPTNLQLPIVATFHPDEKDQHHYYFNTPFQHGSLFAFMNEAIRDETKMVMKRFANVFDLTYKRFLDLQNAEAQAREAIIDASLEKVRGKAMTMQSSKDVTITAGMVFTELRKLGITPIRTGIGLLNKENRLATVYAGTHSEEGEALSLSGTVLLDHHPVFIAQYDCWINQEDYFPVLSKEEVKDYYTHLAINFNVPVSRSEIDQYGFFLPFTSGFLFGWSEKPYTASEINLLNRFKSIIDLTFRRYLDLQKSEANARDAVRQASLDRVRAEIASMRTTNDLEKITPLIWNELTILGVPFIRCGVFIMDELLQLIHTFLSTPDGKAIAAFHLPYSSPGNIEQVLTHWKRNENYIDHWDETAFKEFTGALVKEGALDSPDQYVNSMPKGGFYLHFLPFMQGMLYVGNTIQLSTDELNLVQSVANAFSTAYSRYEDFNKLETAKQQVEYTLSDLKQAQQQLIQSEKMASLGELTAGIAHEIQNPLNFVNNFSEVNSELIEEMKQEISKENLAEVISLANDIKENQEKITHHGKRADAIVKGMLQHSRSSSGVKEPTDINALADEYFRLAYHGLRAKDKSFNATMKTDFDPDIGLVNVIPQDIGRVILNLITNAFYAVTEKKKQYDNTPDPMKEGIAFEPTVLVSTKKQFLPVAELSQKGEGKKVEASGSGGSELEIRVQDNGNGIPQKVIDKIFQPFFTTKPTGQGTGLGLSLSYDIVKAHGGEMKVITNEGDGSVFLIQLPIG